MGDQGTRFQSTQLKQSNHYLSPEICPACGDRISADQVRILGEFHCPHCGRRLEASRRFRVGLHITTLGLASLLALGPDLQIWVRVVAWLFSWAVANLVCIYACRWIIGIRLEEPGRHEEFQRLKLED